MDMVLPFLICIYVCINIQYFMIVYTKPLSLSLSHTKQCFWQCPFPTSYYSKCKYCFVSSFVVLAGFVGSALVPFLFKAFSIVRTRKLLVVDPYLKDNKRRTGRVEGPGSEGGT